MAIFTLSYLICDSTSGFFGISTDFKRSLKRLLKNKLIMSNILSNVFYACGGNVFATFLSRVMEVQFNQPATTSTITGAMSIGVRKSSRSRKFAQIC